MASVFNEDIEGYKSLIELQETFKKGLKENITLMQKASKSLKFDNLKDIEKIDVEIKKISEAEKELIKIKTTEEKLEKKLSALREGQLDEQAKLRVEIQEENKLIKQRAKESLGLVGAYEKESKRLIKLRKEYKDLIISEGKATKQTKKLKKEISKLDKELKDVDESAGQFQRNVGNYPKIVGDATKSLVALAGSLFAVDQGMDTIKSSLESTEEGSEDLRKVTSFLGGAYDQLKNTVATTTLGLVDAGKALFTTNSFAASQQFRLGINKASGAWDDFGNKIVKAGDNAVEAEEDLIDLEKMNIDLEIALARVNARLDKQNAIAGDSTRSFDDMEVAARRVIELQESRGEILVEIASEELEQIQKQIARRKDLAGEESNLIALRQEEAGAITKLIEARGELVATQIENSKQLIEINRDRFEQELDFALDVSDRQKSVNERQITDERTTFEQRVRLIKDTEDLLESSFDNQIQLTEDFVADTLKLRGKNEEEIAESISKINLRKLTELKDEADIRKQLINAGIADEITQNRIREIIIERKAALQDVSDLQADLNSDLMLSESELQTLRRDIEVTKAEENTAARQKELDESESFNNKKYHALLDAFEKEKEVKLAAIELEEDLALQLAKTESEKTKIIEEAEEKRRLLRNESLKVQSDLEIEERKKLAEMQREVIDEISNYQREKFEENQQRLDDEITASEKQQERLLALADKGSEDAQRNLASEQKREAELRLQKQREQEKQKQTELLFKGLDTYSSRLAQGQTSGEAFAGTISDISLLGAALRNIPFFKDGTEDTGTVANPLDSDGGRLAVLHDRERVVDKSNNLKMKGITNSELGNLAESYKRGELITAQNKMDSLNGSYLNNTQMMEQLGNINRTLSELPEKMPDTSLTLDEVKQVMVYSKKIGNQTKNSYVKLNGRKSWA